MCSDIRISLSKDAGYYEDEYGSEALFDFVCKLIRQSVQVFFRDDVIHRRQHAAGSKIHPSLFFSLRAFPYLLSVGGTSTLRELFHGDLKRPLPLYSVPLLNITLSSASPANKSRSKGLFSVMTAQQKVPPAKTHPINREKLHQQVDYILEVGTKESAAALESYLATFCSLLRDSGAPEKRTAAPAKASSRGSAH